MKEVSPSAQVIIHLDDAGNYAKYCSYIGQANAHGVHCDVFGSSYYPFWTRRPFTTCCPSSARRSWSWRPA